MQLFTLDSDDAHEQRLVKEGAWVSGKVNGLSVDFMLDTGAAVTVVSKEVFNQALPDANLQESNVQLVSAGGDPLNVIGKTEMLLELGNLQVTFPVMVIDKFRFQCLLGNDFMAKYGLRIQYDTKTVVFNDGKWVPFFQLVGKRSAFLCTNVLVPPERAMVIQAKVNGDEEGLFLFGEKQPGKSTNKIHVASVLTKCRKNGKVTLEIMNATKSPVQLKQGDEVAELELFQEVQAEQAKDKTQTVIKPSDLSIGHLCKEEQHQLCHVLNESGVAGRKRLGQTTVMEHSIDTGSASPIKQRPYRVPETKRKIIEEEVQKMLVADIIRPSKSPWSSPVVLVTKPDGTARFCVDYRKVNSVTKRDAYPIPRIDDTLDALGKAKFFTTLDLESGYWQIPMKEEDKEKTAFSTSQGHWEFQTMPFGVVNGPACFQRLMNYVLTGLHWTHCLVYLDDIIIFSRTFEEHMDRLKAVLSRLSKAGLTLKPRKCQWVQTSVKYLGHIISEEGIRPDSAKIRAVQEFPAPTSRTLVKKFLGMTSYYRRFVPNYASIVKPLTQLTKTRGQAKVFRWNEEAQRAFEDLKKALLTEPILRLPDFDRQFVVYTDASDYGLGAVLAQNFADGEAVVSYASRQLSSSERNYSTIQKECLAIVWALQYFHHYLFGRTFVIVTDHRPLKWLQTMKPKSAQMERWMCDLQAYSFEVKHRPGKCNGNADFLSRCPVEEKKEEVAVISATDDVLSSQEADEECAELMSYLRETKHNYQKEDRSESEGHKNQYVIEDGILYHLWTPVRRGKQLRIRKQLVVPKVQRGRVLVQNHEEAAHPRFQRMFARIRQTYFWKGMKRDISRHLQNCSLCAQRKDPKNRKHAPLKPIEVLGPLELVGIDYIGPLPVTSSGNKYVLTMQDQFSRWPAAYAVPEISAETTVDCIEKFAGDYGYPGTILSDRGSNFMSSTFRRACKKMGIQLRNTSAYRPQCNGMTERFNGTLKTALAMYTNSRKDDWDQHLRDIVMAYRTTPHSVTKETPAFLMTGREFNVTPGTMRPPTRMYSTDFVNDRENTLREAYTVVRELNRKEKERQKAAYDTKVAARDHQYSVGDMVYLKNNDKKQSTGLNLEHWLGPYKVQRVISSQNVELDLKDSRRNRIVHVDQLKRCTEEQKEDIQNRVKTVLDKMRQRNQKSRLETKYFVELDNEETLWVSSECVPNKLIEEFEQSLNVRK